jgi:hypothetical protein
MGQINYFLQEHFFLQEHIGIASKLDIGMTRTEKTTSSTQLVHV